MRKALKKILLIGVIAIMGLGLFGLSGCSTHRDSIWFELREDAFTVEQREVENTTELFFSELVKNDIELQKIIERYSLTLNSKQQHDKSFFEEHALIFIYFWGGAGNDRINLDDIRVSANTLEVHRTRNIPTGGHGHGIREVRDIIVVRQMDIYHVSEMEIIVRERRIN